MGYHLDYVKTHFHNQKDYEKETNIVLVKALSHYEINISSTNDPLINPLEFKPYNRDNHEYLTLTEYFAENDKYYTITRDIDDEYTLIATSITFGVTSSGSSQIASRSCSLETI